MPKKKNVKPKVGSAIRMAVDVTIKKFINSEDLNEWSYPSSFTAEERAYIHEEARKCGLKSKSRGKGSGRYLTIYKREGSAIMQKDATMNLTPSSRTCLMTLLSKQPITSKERQDCLPPVERCKDTYQDGRDSGRALGRLSSVAPQIPPPACNKHFQPFRSNLPIYPHRDAILHTINDNQVTIVSGPTGCGKTSQVPQYLLEWHEHVGRPCRIICTQPRKIAAVTMSERVALERGDKVGQTVGYQIRLEGRVSPNTILTYCTYGVLLRTLMTGESALASVTHIIMDEIHERDRLSDFLLIILREALSKFRPLRLILMSATFDTKLYSNYFNNCPVISVPGKLFEVKEYFLEDVLKLTGYMGAELDKLKSALNKKKQQAAKLDKWVNLVLQNQDSNAPLSEINANPLNEDISEGMTEMDNAICEAWVNGTESSFANLFYLIYSKNIPFDYQHSQTGVTPLMVAAVRGNVSAVEDLLNIGASLSLRSSNNYTALDWAKHKGHQEAQDIIEAFMLSFETVDNTYDIEVASEKKTLSESDKELLEIYHNSFNDQYIDKNLILSLVSAIHQENTKGSILVFLPGYDDIMAVKDLLVQEDKRLSQRMKIVVLVLHGNMQTGDQKLVFKPPQPGTRKVILATNIAETSITIDDVIYVIDSGKEKEKTYNPLTGVCQLTSIWISKASAQQRKGRAGRTQAGFCYHLYSSIRYETMSPNSTPELLRVPLQELCLYAKQLAPPNTSIVDFLLRAIDPPLSIASRAAVTLLKTIDALDTWEDLTDLGHHLVDLPVDPRYGKMLIYASVLKCLDPILTIVCCLSYRDIFCLPGISDRRKEVTKERAKFAAGSLSDHMTMLRVFQGWQEARKQGKDRQFCAQHFVNRAAMEMVVGTRSQVLVQLRASGFIKFKGSGDIKYVNTNSDNWAVVKAALVGGLYPNIARVDREHNVLRTVKEHKVGIHHSSVLHDGKDKMKDNVNKFPTDWVVYEEMSRVGSYVQIRTATVVSPITIAVFAGPSKIPHDALSDSQLKGCEESDSEEEDVGPDQTACFKVDDWVVFRMDSDSAKLALQLRIKWHALLAKKLRWTSKTLNNDDERVINSIIQVLTAEEQAASLTQPTGIGKRPHLMTSDLSGGSNRSLDYEQPYSSSHNFLSPRDPRGNFNTNTSPVKGYDRYNGKNKNQDSCTPSPTPSFGSSLDASNRPNASCRYFVIKAGQLKNIEASVTLKAWAFMPATQNKILHAYKGGKTVILVFSLQGSGHFQGYARLLGETPVAIDANTALFISGSIFSEHLPIEWIKHFNLPYIATRHLANPFNDNAKVQASRDGQELEPSVGEALCQLWDSPQWESRSSNVPLGRMPYFNHNFKF